MAARLTKSKRAPRSTPTAARALSVATNSSTLPAVEIAAAAEYAHAEKAVATRRAYRTDFRIFRAWCDSRGATALPADASAVAAFLAHEATRNVRPSTIGRRLAAIRYAHKLAGLPLPTDDERVRATLRGIRRTLGTAAVKKTPATAERVIAMAPLPGARLQASGIGPFCCWALPAPFAVPNWRHSMSRISRRPQTAFASPSGRARLIRKDAVW